MSAERKSRATDPPQQVPTGPLDIAANCWMVGHRNPETILQCNTYLRRFDEKGSPQNICIDPGSQFDFSVIEENISQLIGGLDALDGFTVNHQDPDVVGNAPYLCDANPNIGMMVTEEVLRLLQHMLFKPGRIDFANPVGSRVKVIGKHHQLRLVPTPFCHFRGAMAFYDPELRTLFTGDLFGGFNRVGAVHLVAQEADWPGIAQFHQIYMPSREILRHAVREILSLQPQVQVIAPQHGHVITGELVSVFLERMYELPVGHDLVAAQWDEEQLADYREVLMQLLARAELTMGRNEVLRRIEAQGIDDGLHERLRLVGLDLKLEHDGYGAIVRVFSRLVKDQHVEFVVALRSLVLTACSERDLPIPPVGAGLQEGESQQAAD